MKAIPCERKNVSVLVFQNENEIARYGAKIVCDEIKKKPDLSLGLATGSTPVPLYQALIEEYEKGEISFSRIKTYNLDEYYPIDPASPQSFLRFMEENLFDHVDLPKKSIHIPKGNAADGGKEAKRYENELCQAGPRDIQILGIGSDGHIGFNEPGDAFVYSAHMTDLTPETIHDNSRFFADEKDVPRTAITMGIGGIMSSKKCILIATGKNKAEAIRQALKEDPSPLCPASILRFHPDTVFLLDEEAAELL